MERDLYTKVTKGEGVKMKRKIPNTLTRNIMSEIVGTVKLTLSVNRIISSVTQSTFGQTILCIK